MLPLPSYSQIVDLLKKGATLEAQEQIMKLREGALELQEENLKLTEENRDFRREVEKLSKQLDFIKSLKFVKPAYYAEGDAVPFCPVCYERDNKAIHLPFTKGDDGVHCNACQTYIEFQPSNSSALFGGSGY